MEVAIYNKELLKLYTVGKSKKYRIPPQVLTSFFEVVEILKAAKDIYDLWKEPSLNFKHLVNSKARYSLRLSGKYRLEVSIDWENEQKTIGIICIEEISSHYS
ncbi:MULTISPECIES: type II toxin-antitoxin system RelE/ParE family toxin [unclassified Oceanispirochaeta]|uniref:type II toxin-antitoxin system RelE/ParE family toxin n=1 Tax=unclassified Oceanispirochaeta TaxID=2635722 RepID=UPI001313FB49|nr:type II toxin-antitoxin system RelE/ParE family toxin [Oceanispirochaeta sp. M1]MBF9018971.1 type II toxin-antitoxin system RelE/ParE family toxin [Oceanispirochaeta sp. M2]NPD75471.1 hypothetical protein [Oceanispirochaeta sp. M1]